MSETKKILSRAELEQIVFGSTDGLSRCRDVIAGNDQAQRDRIAELEATIKEHESECWCFNPEHDSAKLAALRLRLEEAGKDTALLDWREANPNHSFGRYADGEWTDGRGGSHKTYRAALEAAKETA